VTAVYVSGSTAGPGDTFVALAAVMVGFGIHALQHASAAA
jgi:hypothetical protein